MPWQLSWRSWIRKRRGSPPPTLVNRLRRESRLPSGKTWETPVFTGAGSSPHGMPLALRQQLDQLAQGSFVERGVNVLAFGLPSTGKTHARCALGHRLVEAGHSRSCRLPAFRLVQNSLNWLSERPSVSQVGDWQAQLRHRLPLNWLP